MGTALPVLSPPSPPGAEHLVEVGFKGNRKGYYTSTDTTLREGEYVIVEAERGRDLGRVRSVGGVAKSKCSAEGTKATLPIVRRAEPAEVEQLAVLRVDEDRVRRTAREMVQQHDLKMKVTEAEWQWDRNKLIIYFTADRRVDFRELVRELARTFRSRIELKQIGVRDEAALLGGVGRCGRQLCCATWLREIKPISLQLAKDQNLSLNPQQISGTCGRLMCCLTYEHDSYLQARKRFPREGKVLRTSRGQEKVIGIDVWRDQVTLLDESRSRRVVELAELKKEMQSQGPARRDRDTPVSEAPPEPQTGGPHPDARRDTRASEADTAARTRRTRSRAARPRVVESPDSGESGGRRRSRRGRKRKKE